jgi:pimeloyl-ACP methyl ester carboxylesterase
MTTGVEKRQIRLHGHRLAYRLAGDLESERPVLLLVHGMAGSSATWRDVLPELAAHATVVAPDLPGHGDSDKPRQDYSLGAHANALRDLMVALGIERATIVGQSLGGGVAMQLAYQHPQRCERLVLVSSGGLGPEVSWMLRALTLPGAEYLMPLLFPSFVRDAGNVVGRGLARLGVRWPHAEQEWRAYVSLVEPGNRHSFVRTLRSVVDPAGQAVSAHDRLYLAAHVPTLIVWGRRDRIIPVSHAYAAHEALPASRLVIFEKSGHFPHNEEPEAFAALVTEFITTTAPLTVDESQWRALLVGSSHATTSTAGQPAPR